MVDSRKEFSRQQYHYGDGPQIGGNLNGDIIYELDPKSRAMLAKLSEKAPELAALLREALRNGFISPDVAEALMLAARNINEDVADALLIAGRNINENVAADLMVAGQNINNQVADKFVQVKDDLDNTTRELEFLLNSLRESVGQLSSPQGPSTDYRFGPASTDTGAAWQTGGAINPPSPGGNPGKLGFRFRLTCSSFGIGVMAGAILMHYHLVAYVALASALGIAALVVPWIADARR